MFIIEALIGNTDRHNENWRFLADNQTKEVEFAPIYDCGSCLNPMIDDNEMENFYPKKLKSDKIYSKKSLKSHFQKLY